MHSVGYYSNPDIYGDKVVFVAEDDLWLFDRSKNSLATRITSSKGQIRNPIFCDEGRKIAFSSNEFGNFEVYILDLEDRSIKRLTYFGSMSIVRAWDKTEKQIIFSSLYGLPFRGSQLFKISPQGGEPEPLGYGLGVTYDRDRDIRVIGRFQDDNARWKRYKGGTTGQIWVSIKNKPFSRLNLPIGNHVHPLVINEKIYFLSDYEGISNLYKINPDGSGLEKLTNESEYYFRRARTDGVNIIMQKAGGLYTYNIETSQVHEIQIDYLSAREHRKKKFVDANKFIEQVQINKDDTHALIISRGKPFYFPFWEEGTYQLGLRHGTRYKLPTFHNEKNILYLVSDTMGEDFIEEFNLDNLDEKSENFGDGIGIPYSVKINKTSSHLAITNNRHEVLLIDLKSKDSKSIHKQEFGNLTTIDWSPDGRYLTFTKAVDHSNTQVVVYDIKNDKMENISSVDFHDFNPRFSADGKHIFFLSDRTFHPMIDAHIFQYMFPSSTKIYAVALRSDIEPITKLKPTPLDDKPADNKSNDKDKEEKDAKSIDIEIEGITDRIVELPIPEGRILRLETGSDRIFYQTAPIKGMSLETIMGEPEANNTLHTFVFKDQSQEVVTNNINNFVVSDSKKTLVIHQNQKVRLLPPTHTEKQENKENLNGETRKSKYLNLARMKLEVDPPKEWEQMLKESWKLMKEHYWEENIGGLNWEQVLEKYLILVSKINSRFEFSDLLWELQAETGTSHSYEFGGDYDFPPNYQPAFIGADLKYNKSEDGYEIVNLLKGDVWDKNFGSPLVKSGIGAKEGDIIISVDGLNVSQEVSVQELLMGKRNQEVYINIKRKESGKVETVIIKPIGSDTEIRYRDWVESNRKSVHEKTNNKIGYLHLPDMGFRGVQEFYRYYQKETLKEGLIIDVRFNGGGHTSEIFLEKFSRIHVGYVKSRYGRERRYPNYSVPGPKIAITNESAGSDGDIFSHSFKQMKLGKLIGTRTWGGVVGIWPKIQLVDKTIVTQPEYSFYFNDVQWGVENYGTDPDIIIDRTPDDFKANKDPQLDLAISEILKDISVKPVEEPDLNQNLPIK
jgi:tricorn protease